MISVFTHCEPPDAPPLAPTPLMLPSVASGPITLDVVHHCDVMTLLRTLPDESVNCVVTSPPYFGLRDYGVVGQIGLEPTPQQFVATMVAVFREVRRVLRRDGVCWVNLGDSYAGNRGNTAEKPGYDNKAANGGASLNYAGAGVPNGFKAKDLLGIPWRVAFALQDDGWYLRSDVIWHKPNPMPESVTDRPTKSHEYVFLLSKSERYWYDQEAVREPQQASSLDRLRTGWNGDKKRDWPGSAHNNFDRYMGKSADEIAALPGRNCRTVWTIPTESTDFAHFATYPRKLVERCVLAGCPPKVCAVCGAAWERVVERPFYGDLRTDDYTQDIVKGRRNWPTRYERPKQAGWRPTCSHDAGTRPGIVLDPFMGSGTTALVSRDNGRHYIGCDLNADYVALARKRLAVPFTQPLPLVAADPRAQAAGVQMHLSI